MSSSDPRGVMEPPATRGRFAAQADLAYSAAVLLDAAYRGDEAQARGRDNLASFMEFLELWSRPQQFEVDSDGLELGKLIVTTLGEPSELDTITLVPDLYVRASELVREALGKLNTCRTLIDFGQPLPEEDATPGSDLLRKLSGALATICKDDQVRH